MQLQMKFWSSCCIEWPWPIEINQRLNLHHCLLLKDMSTSAFITIASSAATDAHQAVEEIRQTLCQQKHAFILFFCATSYDLAHLASDIRTAFPGTLVIGCTTAGEIGPSGYVSNTLIAAGFAASAFRAVSAGFLNVQQCSADDCTERLRQLEQTLQSGLNNRPSEHRFALHFIDGMSQSEEMTAHWMQRALGDWPLVGGSAGDDLRFQKPQVFFEGAFHTSAAVLVLVETACPIHVFKTQHFVPGEKPMVVTAAEPETRTVKEINGLPAHEAYSHAIGVPVSALNAALFAEYPVMVKLDGVDYVRSIRSVNADGSLAFYCAIERGLVLRIGRSLKMLENLQSTLANIQTAIGTPMLTLAFDCIFRRIEIQSQGIMPQMNTMIAPMHMFGFSTFGEQWMGVHINQSLTGLAIGFPQGAVV